MTDFYRIKTSSQRLYEDLYRTELETKIFLYEISEIKMTTQIANAFQALVYRLEAQIARTETRLTELKAQLEASKKLAAEPPKAK